MKILDFILLIGVIQGFFLCLGLLVKNFRKPKQNPFFYALLFIISSALLAKYLFNLESYRTYPHVWFFADLTAYVIGPLWYFTILKSIRPVITLDRKSVLMLSPILYYIFFLVYLMTLSRNELHENVRQAWFDWTFYIFCLTVLLVNGSFLWRAHRLLKKYQDIQFPELLIKGQQGFLLVIAVWLVSFVLSFFIPTDYDINLTIYHYAFVSLSFLTFSMAFMALIKPASFYFLTQTYDGSETFVLQQIADRIQQYLIEATPFLNRNYSLTELSQAVQSNPVLTSKAINRILKTSFSDLMNEQRVKYFLKLAREERAQQLTLWALAQEAGFGNKATFYKSFRKSMGTTPKAYLSEV